MENVKYIKQNEEIIIQVSFQQKKIINLYKNNVLDDNI